MALLVNEPYLLAIAGNKKYNWITVLSPIRQMITEKKRTRRRTCCSDNSVLGLNSSVRDRLRSLAKSPKFLKEVKELQNREKIDKVIVSVGDVRTTLRR